MTTALATAMPTPMRLGCGLGNHPTRLDPEWTVTYATLPAFAPAQNATPASAKFHTRPTASKKKVKPTSFRALFSAALSSSPFCSRVNRQTRTPPAKSCPRPMTLSAPKAMRTSQLPAFAPAGRKRDPSFGEVPHQTDRHQDQSPVVHADETGWRHSGANGYVDFQHPHRTTSCGGVGASGGG